MNRLGDIITPVICPGTTELRRKLDIKRIRTLGILEETEGINRQ